MFDIDSILFNCETKRNRNIFNQKEELFIKLIDVILKDTITVPSEFDMRTKKPSRYYTSYLVNYKFVTNLPKGSIVTLEAYRSEHCCESASWYYDADLNYKDSLMILSDTLITPDRLLLVNGEPVNFGAMNMFVYVERILQNEEIKNLLKDVIASVPKEISAYRRMEHLFYWSNYRFDVPITTPKINYRNKIQFDSLLRITKNKENQSF